jgi:hypothetical protein
VVAPRSARPQRAGFSRGPPQNAHSAASIRSFPTGSSYRLWAPRSGFQIALLSRQVPPVVTNPSPFAGTPTRLLRLGGR